MTATKVEPTDEQIKAYADKLPEIYRQVLFAFPDQIDYRRVGDGLVYGGLMSHLLRLDDARREDDIEEAVLNLSRRGFLTVQNDGIVQPTALGERLITALTGKAALPQRIPALPEPTWG